jgi:hypothetical protein
LLKLFSDCSKRNACSVASDYQLAGEDQAWLAPHFCAALAESMALLRSTVREEAFCLAW